ncbi:hypothetical protein GCM10028822_41080 [Hymenobacter terrigena]
MDAAGERIGPALGGGQLGQNAEQAAAQQARTARQAPVSKQTTHWNQIFGQENSIQNLPAAVSFLEANQRQTEAEKQLKSGPLRRASCSLSPFVLREC